MLNARALFAALTFVCLHSPVAQTRQRPESGQQSFPLAQGIIVQLKAAPTLYLPNPSTGIDAVDVRTGKLLWHNSMASVPLLAREDRLLALATLPGQNKARLVFMGTDSGKIVADLPTVEIPGWGPLTYLGGRGSAAWFALEAVSKGSRDFLVWHYRKQEPLRGATPPPHPPKPLIESEHEDSGVVEVNLARATLTPTSETFADRKVRTSRDATTGYEWGPFETDGVRVTLVQVVGKKSTKLLIRRTRGGRTLPDVIVTKPLWNNCNLQASSDRRHVLGACQIEGKHDPFMYDLTVHVAATGERVGHIALDTWPSSFVVWNRQLLYFFPWHVGMVDLRSGEKAFDRPTRDIAYSPLPPGERRR